MKEGQSGIQFFCILAIIIVSSHVSESFFPFALLITDNLLFMFSSICGTEETTKEDDEPVKKKKKKKDKAKQAEEEEVLSEEPPTSPTVEVRHNCTAV